MIFRRSVALLVGMALMVACQVPDDPLLSSPHVVAHRGGKNNFPENTLYAMEKSLALGVYGIELDVQLTKDHEVVLYHPQDLSTWTNGKGKIKDFTCEHLRRLDAAYHFDPKGDKSFPERGKGHKIPTFAEALERFPQTLFVVDLKSLPAEPLIKAIVKVVDQKNAWDRLLFYSTSDEHLLHLRKHKPEARVFESREKTRRRLLAVRNEGVCEAGTDANPYVAFELDRKMQVEEVLTLGNAKDEIRFRLWDQKAMECFGKIKSKQLQVFLFGINKKEEYEEAKKLGAFAVMTDTPQMIQERGVGG